VSGYGSHAPNIPAGSQFDSNAPWNMAGEDPTCEVCGFGLDEDGKCDDCAGCCSFRHDEADICDECDGCSECGTCYCESEDDYEPEEA
jgi:hypothetical protein